MLTIPTINEHVINSINNTEITLMDGQSIVRIASGLIEETSNNELGYMIDSDFFIKKDTEINNALDQLDYFNQRGSRLIQWSITDRLHDAMEPEGL